MLQTYKDITNQNTTKKSKFNPAGKLHLNEKKQQLILNRFQDLRRDLQAVIGTRANINIAQIENYGGETFLSEELAITILQDTKNAFQRCQLVS